MKPASGRLASHPVCAPDKDDDVRLIFFCFCKIFRSFEMGNEDELLTPALNTFSLARQDI